MESIVIVTRPAREEERAEYRCDFCEERIDSEGEKEKIDHFKSEKASLYFSKGDCYPEFSSGEGLQYDVCADCVKDKIIPLIEKELKVSPRKTSYDY